ncbi:MAG: helix-turn-helix domain-containing protein, partial [Paludibacteraceae bacterium]|nr:helix-turn-helix domain-containing protein [Paludibacteraceae bacterium]
MTRYHDLKTKIESIRLRKEGRRSTDIGRMLGVSVSQIDRWQNLYEAHGERGLSNKNR